MIWLYHGSWAWEHRGCISGPQITFILQQVISNLCFGRDSSADLDSEFQAAGPIQQTKMSDGKQGTRHLGKQHDQFNVIFFF